MADDHNDDGFEDDHTYHNPVDPDNDPMRPPSIPTLVWCLHCGQQYDSSLMEYRVFTNDGDTHGFWCCGIEGCDGAGFTFDIFPVDPDFVDPDGRDMGHWVEDEPADPATDDWRPPTKPTPVRCEKCGHAFTSDQMRWLGSEERYELAGWYCINTECEGMGFGEDVRPTDPEYVDEWDRKFYRPGELSRWDAIPPSVDGNDDDMPF